MAKIIKSSHSIKKYSDGGVVGRVVNVLTQPSRESEAAQAEINKDLASKREAAAQEEGVRLQGMSGVPATKPYTNPDGTPFTREQIKKTLGR